MRLRNAVWSASIALIMSGAAASGAEWGLKAGKPELQSATALAFGPDGILFVGDTTGAAVFAIDTGDAPGKANDVQVKVEGLNVRLAETLKAKAIVLRDLAVNPASGTVFLAVIADGKPVLVKVDGSGKLSPLSLENVKFLKATLAHAPEDKATETPRGKVNRRDDAITDLAYAEGKVYVSGVADGGPSPSSVRSIPFPFADGNTSTSVEIFHGAHGRLEDNATIRTFIPMVINGEPNLLAGFTCTPLVKFPLASLEPGKKARGTTIAELGNRNRPLDMITYKKDGKDFLLMANSARGVMKISTENIARKDGITEPVKGGGVAGQTYDTIKDWVGVVQLDKLNDHSAVVVVQAGDGTQSLQTVPLP